MVFYFFKLSLDRNDDGTGTRLQAMSEWTGEGTLEMNVKFTLADLSGMKGYRLSMDRKGLLDQLSRATTDEANALKLAKSAFQRPCDDFSFSLETSGSEPSLVWRRVSGGVKIRLAQLWLERSDYATCQDDIFEAAAKSSEASETKIRSLQERLNSLIDDLRDCRNQLETLREAKAGMEKELFSQFLPILHSKQDMIRKLLAEQGKTLEDEDDNDDSLETEPGKTSSGQKRALPVKAVHDMSSSSDNQSDGEPASKQQHHQKRIDSQNLLDLSP